MSSGLESGTRVVNGEGRGGEDFGDGTCILVTGGAGFIGSIVTLELLVKGLQVVVVDNCSNSYIAKGADKPESLIRVEKLANGKTGKKKEVTFYLMDILEKDKLLTIFQEHNFFCVMHLAGLKSVGESVKYPLKYYEVNMCIATNLLRCMDQTGVTNFVFASSSTVYGPVPREQLPITEEQPTGNCTCAYGRTKYFIEEMLKDCCRANPKLTCVSMRYFNPVGAHESGQIGEDPNGIPRCLMPNVAQVATGRKQFLSVYGNDYDTADGTAVRDYTHVSDVAAAHTKLTLRLIEGKFSGFTAYNFSYGTSYSVLEMVEAFKNVSGVEIPCKIEPRREGDTAHMVSDCSKALRDLDWRATRNLDTMCSDLWNWQSKNKMGYRA